MKFEKRVVCTVCPVGCRMTVRLVDGEYVVSGNKCDRGVNYAQKEMTNPERILTTTVKIKGATLKRLPVRTKGPIPKEMIFECMDEINKTVAESPIKIGEVIIKNILNTGVDVISTREL